MAEGDRALIIVANLNTLSIRFTKFKSLLELVNIDLEQLKKLSWSGIPEEIRCDVWKLLMVENRLDDRVICLRIQSDVKPRCLAKEMNTKNTFSKVLSKGR